MNQTLQDILQNALFQGFTYSELEPLMQQINYQVIQFEKGDVLVQSGDSCDYLLLLTRGSVSGDMMDFSGKTLKIEDVHAGKPLAIAFIFGKQHTFPVTLTANEHVKAVRIWRDDLLKLMQLNRKFLHNYLNLISNKAQFLSEKLHFLSFKTIREKYAHFLLKYYPDANINPVRIKESQQQMADLFGVTRPSLARVMAEFEDEKIISVRKKQLTILNMDQLQGMT
ncbi:MAG: helix-turn-helix domain-containing protein [Bacteroidetes bacterium]|jgi:CRP-like cAMP-binding protein|nr:helix-turn-helix domain-containing protein [Bacteroidota bacterium]